MMTSSGSVSYRVGGSLSSSNLSPLAPPFKVDKSVPKPNSMNPSVNFPDVPVYGTCFDPAPGKFWNPSSSAASVPQCVATESVVTNINCSTAPNMYGYRDSQSSTSPVYYASTSNVSAYDPFTYEPFPSSISSNTEEATKPFYPPFISPPPQKDGFLGLGVASGPGYDLLSYSGSSLGGRGAAQSDHLQAVSGDKAYKSKWGYFWSGSNESEHEKWTEYAGFVPKELNLSNSSSNKSPLFVDGSNKTQPFGDINVRPFVDGKNSNHPFGDANNKNHLKQGAYVTQDQGSHGQVSSVKDNCFDIFGGAYSLGNLGIDQKDCKSSSRCSRTRTSASASVSRECPHLQEPALDSVTSFGTSHKAIGSSPDEHFSQASFYMFGSASTANTFPISMTKLQNAGSSSSMESASSAVKVNSMGIDATNQSNPALGYTSSYQMEPHMPLGFNCQSSIRIRRPVPSSRAASSCEKLETADGRLDDKGAYEKISSSPQLSHRLSLNGLNIEASDTEIYPAEKHSVGSEGHNPAEDSPCWRGASSNRFSPFEQSESVASDGFLKKLDGCVTSSSQDFQHKINASDSKDISAGNVNNFNVVERPSVSDCISNDNEDFGSANPKHRCFDLNTGDSLQFADYHASTVGCNTINKSKADSVQKGSLAEQLILEGCDSSGRKITETPSSEERGSNEPIAAEALSGFPSTIDKSSSHPRNPASENSDSRIDVSVLLRTMMNLSEIFRSHCSSNRAEIEEKHSLSIKQILNNLNASMMISGHTAPTMISGHTAPTAALPSPDTIFKKQFPVAQMVNDAEALAASMKLGGATEDFLDDVSFKDDTNTFGDVNITEAVKKLLSENLQEEEMDQQKLYKNLWLEAEASLCVMTAKARFIRMKTDMKRTRDEAKDKDNPMSSNISADIHRAAELAAEAKDTSSLGGFPKPTTTSQNNDIEEPNVPNSKVATPENERSRSTETCFPLYGSRPGAPVIDSDDSLTTSRANDVDSCVMARYQILQNRVDCMDSLNHESNQYSGEHKCPSSLYESVKSFHASGTTTKANDPETSRFGGYQILKCLDDSDYLNKGKQLPGDENYLPDIDSSSPDKELQDSQMSNSLGVTDEREASVMARFRILQSRMDHSNSMINVSAPVQVNTLVYEDGTEMGISQQQCNVKIASFGPYPALAEDEDVNLFNNGVNGQTVAPTVKTNRMSSVIYEGWYDNDCSSSEWEHISRVDV
ncbi:putative bifunctional folylpolyglutamate synthase/dihydropteroate synthase [Bienertia sinuspersici]